MARTEQLAQEQELSCWSFSDQWFQL